MTDFNGQWCVSKSCLEKRLKANVKAGLKKARAAGAKASSVGSTIWILVPKNGRDASGLPITLRVVAMQKQDPKYGRQQ